jgi:hypothetical protein
LAACPRKLRPGPKHRGDAIFQLWKLKVNDDRTAVLTCDDGNGKVVYRNAIEFTDFPLPEIALYFTTNTILLPSEY